MIIPNEDGCPVLQRQPAAHAQDSFEPLDALTVNPEDLHGDIPAMATRRVAALPSPPASVTDSEERSLGGLSSSNKNLKSETSNTFEKEIDSLDKKKALESETQLSKDLGSAIRSQLTPCPTADVVPHINADEPSKSRDQSLDTELNLERGKLLKLTPEKLRELTLSAESLPIRALTPEPSLPNLDASVDPGQRPSLADSQRDGVRRRDGLSPSPRPDLAKPPKGPSGDNRRPRNLTIQINDQVSEERTKPNMRSPLPQRTLSTPASVRSPWKSDKTRLGPSSEDPMKADHFRLKSQPNSARSLPSPMPQSIPLPPLSIPTYLQLELSSQRPSQLYIHRPPDNDFPYESSRAKIERLLNFLLLPPHLESVLWFGTLACLDSWLYTFTILPLRLLKSFYILGQSWSVNILTEAQYVSQFIYNGTGRMWRRRRNRGGSIADREQVNAESSDTKTSSETPPQKLRPLKHHKRSKSVPSMLLPDDKADILKGLLIICTCLILLRLDASRMYHWIRGQAAIKLYVIYNVLEVCDRLFSAIGQDVLECLFSREALERKPDGHSKILRPFWLFILALTYTVIHSTALFYQVITLNVAVNSYSNALITLLMSNQFVEIKSTVFKKFEKENLFQLTCADVVERFQLWHMLIIIASRNIVETGGVSKGFGALISSSVTSSAPQVTNSSIPFTKAVPPITASSILPRSFTLVPSLLDSITSYVPTINNVLGPFLVVLGSEMIVDWIKHSYINKFNNTRPAIYGRFLDVLAKDYYTNAFADQNLTKRLGLPVIPLSCLLIRASVQTYQMFMAAWVPSVSPNSSTSLASIHEQYSASRAAMPSSTAATFSRTIDEILQGIPSTIVNSQLAGYFTPTLILVLIFLVLLACKLVLGMLLLSFARSRYRSMKEREKNPIHPVEGGRRIGGWGVVEVDEDKRRWLYDDDPAGMRALRDREEKERVKRDKEREKGVATDSFDKVKRYEMVAKRIW